MHEANALTKRIFKYVFSVVFLSFLFTFTRFFEANVSYIDHDHNNLTEKIIALEPTEMRSNPIYTSYLNWSRLIVLGIIPFVLLVFLNASIYKVKCITNLLSAEVKNSRVILRTVLPLLTKFLQKDQIHRVLLQELAKKVRIITQLFFTFALRSFGLAK